MNDWFELTVWELAFLAGAEPGRRTLLDEVSSAGDWLRAPELQDAGRVMLQERVGGMPEVPEEFWALLTAAARLVAATDTGSVVTFRAHGAPTLCLVTAVGGDRATQIAIRGRATGIRPTSWPLDRAGLVDELQVVEADEVLALRLGPGGTRDVLRWERGALATEAGEPVRCEHPDAVRALCRFVGGETSGRM